MTTYDNLPLGTPIHYTGDVANQPGDGTITAIHPPSRFAPVSYDFLLDDGREITAIWHTAFEPSVGQRFYTKVDWDAKQRPKPRGLRVDVYRNTHRATDCTLNGITARHSVLTLVGPGIDEVFEAGPDAPAVELSSKGGAVNVIPAGETRWTMFGGNFIYSCDSRFSALNNGAPIAVHDRIEA